MYEVEADRFLPLLTPLFFGWTISLKCLLEVLINFFSENALKLKVFCPHAQTFSSWIFSPRNHTILVSLLLYSTLKCEYSVLKPSELQTEIDRYLQKISFYLFLTVWKCPTFWAYACYICILSRTTSHFLAFSNSLKGWAVQLPFPNENVKGAATGG